MNRVLIAAVLAVTLLSRTAPAQSQSQPPSAMALPRIAMVNVLVTDLARSERFYQQVFGLSAARAYNAREHVFTLADQDGPRLELVLTDTPHPNGLFAMMVSDVDAVISRTPAAGGTVVRPAGPPAGNYREGRIADPDGMEIKVIQPVTHP